MKLSVQRTHMQAMVEFATNPEALVFTKLEGVNNTEFFVYAEYPLWKEDKEYIVRTDMTVEEAKADRTETLKALAEAKEAQAVLAQY